MTTKILLEWCRSDGPIQRIARFDAWPDAADGQANDDGVTWTWSIAEAGVLTGPLSRSCQAPTYAPGAATA